MKVQILIVDDNPTNMKLAADVLEGAGCKAFRAGDAEEALAMLVDRKPDLILMDLEMPGMDGFTLTARLKSDDRYRRIPIVALTASAMKGDDVKALSAGCQGYITKPIDTRRFVQQVFEFLPTSLQLQTTSDKALRGGQPSMRLLVVDDSTANRKLLRARLENEGHSVREAANGREALQMLDREPIDGIVSDILMPLMDGFRLCREIRGSGHSYAGAPFILYTATYDSPADRQLATAVGADDYLIKPAPLETIMESLRKAQGISRPQESPPRSPEEEVDVLEQYNAALVRKLEERNMQLQRSLTDLQTAHAHILELNECLEIRVEQRTAALEVANKELESFSYSVAHDLRAPLRHICGYAEFLRETAGNQLNEECQGFVDKIMGSAKRMDQLIADLLSFARTARTELAVSEVNLNSLLDEALQAVHNEIQGRDIQWKREPLPKVRGDPALLRQVFINLISNAIKYTRPRPLGVIEIGYRPGRTHEVVLFVRDNGVGFDMRHAGHLFGVFQRLHAAPEFEGTGIGLANVQRIVARHGGRVWAESSVDHGATFYCTLPPASAPKLNP
jgi:CheY-like chemotaxis protein/signal transduction histidine kinase